MMKNTSIIRMVPKGMAFQKMLTNVEAKGHLRWRVYLIKLPKEKVTESHGLVLNCTDNKQ